jgi:hypothetical protein
LAVLTAIDARRTWNVGFDSTAGTWGLIGPDQGKAAVITVLEPRSYRDLISGDKLRTTTIARAESTITLSINGALIDDAILTDLSAPLLVGVGAHMPRERIPEDAERFSVLITRAALADANGDKAPT